MKTQYLLIVLLFTLSACGFHLRGTNQKVSVNISDIFLSSRGATAVSSQVKAQLGHAGAKTVANKAQAKFVLDLENESFNQTVLSVSAQTGKVEEYQITLSVYMSVYDGKGEVLVADEQVRLSRDYTFDENAVLGKFAEEQILRTELLNEAASQIVRRLSSVAGGQ